MNKRTMFMIGAVSAALITSAAAVDAKPTTHSVYVDGNKVNCAAYAINGNNYFKLRDIAAMINGSGKQFEVTWNEAAKRIDLTSSRSYTTVGGEMAAVAPGTQNAKASTATVYKDGKAVTLAGYSINDNNYYKLRDVAQAFDFGVGWDEATQKVDVKTDSSYSTDDASTITEPIKPAEDNTKPTGADNSSTSSSSTGTYYDNLPEDEDGNKIWRDYRQAGDPGIRGDNVGNEKRPMYQYYPSYNVYSAKYQNLLDTCGEEIITKTIYYYTYCETTREEDLSGFPVEVRIVDDRVTPRTWEVVKILYVDSPSGSFELSMPKSVYEKVLAGDRQTLTIGGTGVETAGMSTTQRGRRYLIFGSRIVDSDIRDVKPTSVRLDMAVWNME